MTNKENYVCVIELLNFKKISLESGKDLLQIRVENIVNQVRKILNTLTDVSASFVGDRVELVINSTSNQFEKFVEMIMDYNKHALLFGIPHRAIVFKENSIRVKEENLNLNVSKEAFSAMEQLEQFDLAGILIDSSLYDERKDVFAKYTVSYNNAIVLKLSKRPIAEIALQGIKNSINNSFNKIGVNDFSTQYSTILKNTLRFVDVQNV